MSNAFGIKALMPVDAPHVLGFGSARTGTTDLLLDIWNGSTSGSRVFAVQKDGKVWLPDGAVTAPALTFTDDLDSGIYRIGANNIGVALNGSKVLDIGTATTAVTGALTASGAITGGAGLTLSGAIAGATNIDASGNITSATWAGATIAANRGGTGWASYLAGDILYANTTSTLAQLGIGAANTVLTSSGSAPQWSTSLALAGGATFGGNVTVNADLTVTGTLSATISSVAASSITAGTFGAGDYTFPADVNVTGQLIMSDNLVLSTLSERIVETDTSPGAGFGVDSVSVNASSSATVATGTDYKAILITNGQVCGMYGWNGGTTLSVLFQHANLSVTGTPGAGAYGVQISSIGTITIYNGSGTGTKVWGVYVFKGGN